MEKTTVMLVSTVGLIYDGITNVILSYLQAMDLSDIDVYIAGTVKIESAIKNQLEILGCHIIYFPSRREKPALYFKALTTFLRKRKINVIHAHGNSATLTIEMMAGLLGGCKKRIAHSHNTRCDRTRADKMFRPLFYHLYTDALACGQDAGEWLFPGRPFRILKNGRDVARFSFNQEKRDRMRAKFGIKDELAIGHIGGFVEQKNHKFLLEIYREIHKIEPAAKLFMIGDGVLKKKIEKLSLDLKDVLIFTGNVDNVPDYLQMMDGMLLPSLFEGLPLVVVEWQINGLPALLSNTIDKSCAFTDLVEFMLLEMPAVKWAEKILQMIKLHNRKKTNYNSIVSNGFDIKTAADELRKIYIQGE